MTREEAINIIKKAMPTFWKETKEAVEILVPEFKENEDERIRKALLRCCDDWDKGQFGCMAKEDVSAIRAYLEKQKEQKPAEWSEEDEFFRQQLIVYCENCIQDSLAAKCVDWLKSLHPQPHWKPSEKQIGALERAIVKMHTTNDIGILVELRDNLKKL